ncbi:MAG: DUF1501 domain-containing protein [Burkholderiaceae bacterium]
MSATQRRRFDFIQRMNRRLHRAAMPADARLEGMIHSLETAFRMQTAAPDLVDLSKETEATKKLYGIGGNDDGQKRPRLPAGPPPQRGRRALRAGHAWTAGITTATSAVICPSPAPPPTSPAPALIRDLKSRGLLDDTLVVWSGEFGRTPWSQDLSGTSPIEKHGREHQPDSFCTWMAGGGVKAGFMHGETDEFGYRPVAGKVHLHDLHATILHLLGLDHEQPHLAPPRPRLPPHRRLWRSGARDHRLTKRIGAAEERESKATVIRVFIDGFGLSCVIGRIAGYSSQQDGRFTFGPILSASASPDFYALSHCRLINLV